MHHTSDKYRKEQLATSPLVGYKSVQGMNQDYVIYNSSDDDEVEIDLGKMFAAIFRKTRQILATTIVLALVVSLRLCDPIREDQKPK